MKNNIGKVIFKRNKVVDRKVSPKFSFKKSSKKAKSFSKNRNNHKVKSFVYFLIGFIAILFVGYLLTLAYSYVVALRSGNDVKHIETVYGFDIPSYPGSEFVFKDTLNEEKVKRFISSGNSVYRLPRGSEVSQAYEYYNKGLAELGWTYIGFVDLVSEEKMPGQYWVKGEKGLRIYSRLNDIWYQNITKSESETGMADLVRKETARKLLLLTTEKVELLPDFPWRLSYPTEYSTKYYSSSISSLQSVSFQKIGSNNVIYLEPQGYFGGNTFDGYIDKAMASINKVRKERWQVVNSVELSIKGNDIVRADIINSKKQGYSVAINNSENNVVYVITTLDYKDPFFEYILNNLKSAVATF
jgi:hypothetical protein